MARWADDPERAADALIAGCLHDLPHANTVLLVNPGAQLPALMTARGTAFAIWNRRLAASQAATAWPPAGPFGLALVRLPKARDEQRMAAHAALSVLAPGGRLVLYGGNDEGIRSASAMLADAADGVETMAARGHGRVLSAVRHASREVKGTLAAWRTVTPMDIAGRAIEWVSYPGLFAAGRLDEGTALLLTALPTLMPSSRVLDYGCGPGAIGAAVSATMPGVVLDMLDNDAVALEAVRENVPAARRVLGMRAADAGAGPYAAILSNPPLHRGITEDHGLLEQLVADAPAYLAPDGVLQMVVQHRVPLERLLAQHFARTEVVAENGRYRVWRSQRG